MKEKLHRPDTKEVPSTNDKWDEALRRHAEDAKEVKVHLVVSGGMPSKSYYFLFILEKNGRLYCRYQSKLDRRNVERSKKADTSDIEQLTLLLLKTRVFDFLQPTPRFVPDTVVGKLEIHVGNLYHLQYFAADEKQGAYQQMPTHPQLPKVVDWIYDRASQALDKKNLKP